MKSCEQYVLMRLNQLVLVMLVKIQSNAIQLGQHISSAAYMGRYLDQVLAQHPPELVEIS
jgi:hypothetical protein